MSKESGAISSVKKAAEASAGGHEQAGAAGGVGQGTDLVGGVVLIRFWEGKNAEVLRLCQTTELPGQEDLRKEIITKNLVGLNSLDTSFH